MLVPEGEKIQIKDAISLVMAFGRKASLSEEQREKLENWSLQVSEAHGEGESSLLTYGEYIELTAIWDQDREIENTEEDPEKELDQKYRKEDLLLFQDFTEGYQKRLEAFQIQDQIVRETLELLGKGSDASIIDSRGNTYGYENMEAPVYCVAEAYVERNEGEDDRILVLTERKKDSFTLKNALITVNDADGFYFLWSGEEMYCPLKIMRFSRRRLRILPLQRGKLLTEK